MTFEAFKELTTLLKTESEESLKLYNLNFDDSEIKDKLHKAVSILLKSHYGEETEDTITWWLYEDGPHDIYYNQNSPEYEKYFNKSTRESARNLEDVEELWKYCEEIRKLPDFKEYIPPPPMTEKEMQETIEKIFKQKT